MHRHHHSQQLGFENSVHFEEPFILPSKCIGTTATMKMKHLEGAVDLKRLPDLSCALGPDGVSKIKNCHDPFEWQRPPSAYPQSIVRRKPVASPRPIYQWLALGQYTSG